MGNSVELVQHANMKECGNDLIRARISELEIDIITISTVVRESAILLYCVQYRGAQHPRTNLGITCHRVIEIKELGDQVGRSVRKMQ